MATQVRYHTLEPPDSADDRLALTELVFACSELLALDALWTQTVERGDDAAIKVGAIMQARLAHLQQTGGLLATTISTQHTAFNAAWAELSETTGLSLEQQGFWGLRLEANPAAVISEYFSSAQWPEILQREANTIASKLDSLEIDGPRIGDLATRTKRLLTLLAVGAVLALGAPLVALAAGAPVPVVALAETGQLALLGLAVFKAALVNLLPPPAGIQ